MVKFEQATDAAGEAYPGECTQARQQVILESDLAAHRGAVRKANAHRQYVIRTKAKVNSFDFPQSPEEESGAREKNYSECEFRDNKQASGPNPSSRRASSTHPQSRYWVALARTQRRQNTEQERGERRHRKSEAQRPSIDPGLFKPW